MADITLQASRRTTAGKKVKRLRREGTIPGRIYGAGMESIPVQIDVQALRGVLAAAGSTTVVDVSLGGADGNGATETYPALIEGVTRHPSSGRLLHVDLHRVDLSRPVRATVPISLLGESAAVGAGGVLLHALDALEVEAMPAALPHTIEVDISVLRETDDQLTVGDLQLPSGVATHSPAETLVAKVVASKLELEVAAEVAETAAAAAEVGAPAVEEPEAEAAEPDQATSQDRAVGAGE
jgi:large subunit ribosomal protein L25